MTVTHHCENPPEFGGLVDVNVKPWTRAYEILWEMLRQSAVPLHMAAHCVYVC